MQKNKSQNIQNKKITVLKERLEEVSHFAAALAVLHWDQDVHMPRKGAEMRAKTISHIASYIHKKFIEIDHDGLLSGLKEDLDAEKLSGKEAAIVSETWRSFEREKKLPETFVRELAEVVSNANQAWIEARQKSNFMLFQPWLEKIVALKRKEAGFVGYTDSPYDALLDGFEPGMKTAEASQILNDLKDFLVPFIEKIKKSKVKIDQKKILGKFPLPEQLELNKYIAEHIGYDFEAGRIDISTHPFTTNFNSKDVRITTRYSEKDLLYAIGSTIHETGHALYEQGLPIEHFGTPLAESVSLGIHESQSRMWENLIGKSKEFWKFFYPKIQKRFPQPLKKVSLDDFHLILNKVQPSLIRVESDEVTYNLHIIIRFEIEKELIEGSIEVKDLPKIWSDKVQQYLGITIPDNAHGVLQDVHWSAGLFGYFPTYSFGNLYAAQFYATMKKQISGLEKNISTGNFTPILEWLRKNIHQHGKLYNASMLVQKVTGEQLNSRYFADYITEKYSKIYKLN